MSEQNLEGGTFAYVLKDMLMEGRGIGLTSRDSIGTSVARTEGAKGRGGEEKRWCLMVRTCVAGQLL